MIPILLALAFAADYDYPLDENRSLRKRLKKAAKKVTKPVKKAVKHVTKPVEKAVKKVTKPVMKLIHDTRSSEWAEPIRIDSIESIEESKDYSTTDLNTLTNTIISEFSVNKASLENFFKRARFASKTKTLLNTINFGALNDVRNRVANLGCAVVKVTKSGNSYTVNVRKVGGQAKIWANNVRKSKSSTLGFSHSSTSRSWRPLTSGELTGVYNAITQEINAKVSQIRNI